jgi:hypothetical protein
VADLATRSNVNASLEDGAEIHGTVTDPVLATGVQNVTVDLLDVDNFLVTSACTAADGSYTIDPVAPSVYVARFSPAGSCGNAGPYAIQWYDHAATQNAATAVLVGNPGQILNLIDATMLAPPVVPPPGGNPPNPTDPTTPTDPTNPSVPAGAPDTVIDQGKVKARRGMATFSFSGSGGTGPLTFECSLAKAKAESTFKACSSPATYKRLKKGKYRFEVRARGADGTVDASPAVQSFKSKKKRK